MENRSHFAAAVGFVLILSLAVIVFYFWLSTGDNANRKLAIETGQSVGGLTAQSPVKYKGLQVGHVASVGFDPHHPDKVRIVFLVRNSVPLNQSSYAELTTQGITGLSNVSLFTPKNAAQPLTGHPPMLPLKPGLLDKLKKQGKKDMATISNILNQVDSLTGGQNAQNIQSMLAQINRATQQLNTIETELEPTLRQLPALTNQLTATVKQLHQVAEQAVPATQSVQNLGESGQRAIRQLNDQLLPHIDSLTEQMQETARQIQNLSSELANKPNSVLTGPPKRRPGPGEPGFSAPGQ